MNDVAALNAQLLSAMRRSEEKSLASLESCPIVLATLDASVADMKQCMASAKKSKNATIPVEQANRAWLEHARLLSKDALGGHVYRLVEIRITLAQAQFFSGLSNQQIAVLSTCWDGLIAKPIDLIASNESRAPGIQACFAASAITAVGAR